MDYGEDNLSMSINSSGNNFRRDIQSQLVLGRGSEAVCGASD